MIPKRQLNEYELEDGMTGEDFDDVLDDSFDDFDIQTELDWMEHNLPVDEY